MNQLKPTQPNSENVPFSNPENPNLGQQFLSLQQVVQNQQAQIESLLGIVNSLNEIIRNVVFFDQDTKTTRSTTTAVPAGGGNVVAPKVFDQYLKAYFRGKVFLIPAYKPAYKPT